MTVSPETTVGDIASEFPQAIRLFQRCGIEFCCDGRRRLGDLCRERQLPFDDLARAIADAATRPRPRPLDWNSRPLSHLIAHIVDAFHDPLREELPRLHRMAVRVQAHTDSSSHALDVVLCVLTRFRERLEPHMATAENELFPLIVRAEAARARDGDWDQFRQLRRASESDHHDAGYALQVLRNITGRYDVPPRACATLRDLYRGLKELEQLMQLYVHLENNVLFRRAEALLSEAKQ
jgi:regulator of cell morphogenesis and NO signaling